MKINHIIFLLCMMGNYLCFAGIGPSKTQIGKMPKMGTPEFDSMIMEQMQLLEKELASKSPKEQEEFIKMLAQVGEEITKEAESKGYENPFDYIEKELVEVLEQDNNQEIEEQPQAEASIPTPTPDKKNEQSLAELLKVLAAHVAKLRDTTISTPLASKVAMIKYRLDDLVYFLELFQTPELLEHSAKDEHKKFISLLQNLEIKLAPLSANLSSIPFSLSGENDYSALGITANSTPEEITQAYHGAMALNDPERVRSTLLKQDASIEQIKKSTLAAQKKTEVLQKSYKVIVQHLTSENNGEAMVEAFIQATGPEGVLDGFKQLLEKYQPTLAQQRAQVEQAQAQARKAQEKAVSERPAFRVLNALAFDNTWRPSYSFETPTTYDRSSAPHVSPSEKVQSIEPSKASSDRNPATQHDTPKKQDVAEKNDKHDTSTKSSVAKDVQRRLAATESTLSAIKTSLKVYAQDIKECSAYLRSQEDNKQKNEHYSKIFTTIAQQLAMIPIALKRALNEFKTDAKKISTYKQGLSDEWQTFVSSKEYEAFASLIAEYEKMLEAKNFAHFSTQKTAVVTALKQAKDALDQVSSAINVPREDSDKSPENKQDLESSFAKQKSNDINEYDEPKEQDGEPNNDQQFTEKPSVTWNEFININDGSKQALQDKQDDPTKRVRWDGTVSNDDGTTAFLSRSKNTAKEYQALQNSEDKKNKELYLQKLEQQFQEEHQE